MAVDFSREGWQILQVSIYTREGQSRAHLRSHTLSTAPTLPQLQESLHFALPRTTLTAHRLLPRPTFPAQGGQGWQIDLEERPEAGIISSIRRSKYSTPGPLQAFRPLTPAERCCDRTALQASWQGVLSRRFVSHVIMPKLCEEPFCGLLDACFSQVISLLQS